MRIVVTGANGAIGQQVLRLALQEPLELVAAVRSERAASQLPPLPEAQGRVARIDYGALDTLIAAFEGAHALIHLPGILIEKAGSTYELSNIETTRVAVEAAQRTGVEKIVLVSAVGADPESRNRFFRTKGEAEELVRRSGLTYTILRAPLVLGPRTEGAAALQRNAKRRSVWLLGGGRHVQQPLDVRDLALASLRSAMQTGVARNRTLDVVGPERLEERDLVLRAARLLGRTPRIRPIPSRPLRALLALRTRLFGPGFSPDTLEVILADTHVDAQAAAKELGISLSPLERTLRRSLGLAESA